MLCLGHKSLGVIPQPYLIYWGLWDWKCWASAHTRTHMGGVLGKHFSASYYELSAETSCCSSLCSPWCCLPWLPSAPSSGCASPGNCFSSRVAGCQPLLLPQAQASQSICHTSLFTPISIWSSMPKPQDLPVWWHCKCPAAKVEALKVWKGGSFEDFSG